ncbi:MAG: hypothetical protein KGJ39_03230 [Acidobacteriota bacterium]|nr:hypothetical protein [Acidobacteriota bacterium]
MDEGSARATRWWSRRARGAGAAVLVAIVVTVIAGAMLRGSRATLDPWVAGYASVDAGAVAQDAAQIRADLGRSPSSAVAALRYDCAIGRRDAARLLSHPAPANATLRRVYETALQENWRLYAQCASTLARSPVDARAVVAQLERQLALLHNDESRVNAAARAVTYAPVFSGP